MWIALAIAQRASVILFDEPTSHLDLKASVETLQLVRELAAGGALVVAVLHQLEEAAAFADRVIVLGDGGVIADGPPERALTAESIERAYGVRSRWNTAPTGWRSTATRRASSLVKDPARSQERTVVSFERDRRRLQRRG